MKIAVINEQWAEELMRAFNAKYQYLKMDFFDVRHHKEPVMNSSYIAGLNVCTCHLNIDRIAVDFSELTIVSDLERAVWKNLGVHVRIFRKFGKAWLPIVITSGWTLKLQNEQGRAFSLPG